MYIIYINIKQFYYLLIYNFLISLIIKIDLNSDNFIFNNINLYLLYLMILKNKINR